MDADFKQQCVYISSVYSPFSDRVGLPLHNIPSSGVLMKSIGAEFLRPDVLPGVNNMCWMQCRIVLNSSVRNSINTVVQICVHNPTQNIINYPLNLSYDIPG